MTGDSIPAMLAPASTARRVIAYVVDVILLATVSLAVWELVDRMGLASSPVNTPVGIPLAPAAVVIEILLVSMSGVYFIGLWRAARRTLGMRLMRLWIGRAEDGIPLTWRQGIVRWLLLEGILSFVSMAARDADATYVLVSLSTIGWTLVLIVSTIRDPMHRGVHDRWSGSLVVVEHAR